MRKFIAQGIYFEPAAEDALDPVMGTNKGSIGFGDSARLLVVLLRVSFVLLLLSVLLLLLCVLFFLVCLLSCLSSLS